MMERVSLKRDPGSGYASIENVEKNEPDMLLTTLEYGDMTGANPEGRNRRKMLLRMLELDQRPFFSLRQIHSQKVYLSGQEMTDETDGDGLVAGDQNHLLSVTVADCMPIYLFDRLSRHFAIVHSGWKGTGIAARAAALMTEQYNCKKTNITAVLGPSIRNCCYRVDSERAGLFGRLWGEESVTWRDGENGSVIPYLDLRIANTALLKKAGIEDIRYVDECTACSADLGSFRREGPAEFTHMLAMIGFFK